MILVDTSVWIAAFRDAEGAEALELSPLLDSDEVALAIPVLLELLSGASRSDRAKLRRTLTSLPCFYPARETWDRMESWIEVAARSGERFGFADLLIGSIAADEGATVWSLDADFRRLTRLKFIELYRPTGRFQRPS